MIESKSFQERALADRSLKHGIHKLIYGRDTPSRRPGAAQAGNVPSEPTTLSLTKSEV